MKKYLLSLLFTTNVVFAFAQGIISTLTCTTPTNTGTLTRGVAASGVNSTVTYTGGDGGAHGGQTVASTGVTGLTATLAAGNFAVGNGSLLYSITGTPATSGTASFALSIGGQICTLTRTVALPAGTITTLTCSTATNNGVLTAGLAASGVGSSVPYTGGNGGTFALQSVASTGVTGLSATRSAGTLASGSGSVTYNITGTPAASGTANFAISLGGQSCTLSRTVNIQGTITALTCSSATNAGTLFSGIAASSVSFSVPYTGGNGGGYQARSVTSTGVTGLTASLAAGVFASGSGNLTFTITGTPSAFGTASFALSIGGQSCTVTVPVLGSITTIACASSTPTGTLTSGVAASGVSSSIPYTGGNGGPHNGQTVISTGVTGLTATLAAGSFVSGNGSLIYAITGTPATGGTATFALNIGGRTCSLTRTVPGSITTIDCSSATNNGSLTSGVAASGVSSIVPYTGGNGGTHSGQSVNSTGVAGLTATLAAGSFLNGAGSLTYNITGTPATGGTASFALNIGGRTCTLTRIIPGTITAINCLSATNNGLLTSGVAASGVSSILPYTGGNSGPHSGQTVASTGVTGLTATLVPGTFASGSGSLVYTISGTPSSNGTASFALNIGGRSCTLDRIVFIPGTITLLDCGTATNNGTLTSGVAASGVSSIVPYTDGNGGSYTAQSVTSTGVTGLTATLAAGVFASGSGSLTYSITGTPAAGGTASFAISIGGQSCTLTRIIPGAISALACGSASRTGTLASGVAASGVSSSIPYSGGNGGPHNGQTVNSTVVTGLTATLSPANFLVGAGNVVYTITGTPATGGTARFALSIGGRSCELTFSVPGAITALNCASAVLTGVLTSGVAASGVSVSVPYTGGNGGTYTAQNVASTGVTGLTASLVAGTFANGAGNLTYNITGTPARGGTASFALNIGGRTCTLNLIIPGTITALNCSTATNSGILTSSVVASGVSSSVPYTGGNSGAHSGQTVNSTGVTGLTATLAGGSFLNGSGSLIYNITGTPSDSGKASFALSIGGQSCTLTRSIVLLGTITVLNCSSATNNGTLTSGVAASGVSSLVPYTGGNGGSHTGQTVTSSGVTGLTATLSAGVFANGSGNLTYTITGTPASGGTASFALNIGGQTCTLTRTIPGAIGAIACASVSNAGFLYCNVPAGVVTSSIPYSSGNGGPHTGQTVASTGVLGLTATLPAGSFLSGSGSVVYTITGTPATTGTASFAISIGGKACTLTRTVTGGIATLNCSSASNNGNLITGVAASGVSSVVPYTGACAGSYTGQTVTSTGVTGLTATLGAGNFVSGSGTVTYTITGTPVGSGTASFALNIGGRTCTLTRTVTTGTITALTCTSASSSGTLSAGVAATGVSSLVPFTGGNGGTHNGQIVASTGVTGLTATLNAGSFPNGAGNLTYTITGTPSTSGTASFALNIGGRTCALTRTVSTAIPSVSTTAVTFVTTNTAISGGNVSLDGGLAVTSRGICWGTAQNPTIALPTKTSNGTGTGSFISNITGLTPGTIYYVRAYATNSLGTAYGTQVSFTTVAATVSDADGNVYDALTIGTQVWMKKNLKVSKYRNGDPIPGNLTPASWASTTSGAFDRSCFATYDSIYGKQYNWYAVSDPRGLCPAGWHVPTKNEWTVLIKFLDPASDTTKVGSASTNTAGSSMKKVGIGQAINGDWYSSNTDATNSSLFTARPGGFHSTSLTGFCQQIGRNAYFWSSTSNASCCSWYNGLNTFNGVLERNVGDKRNGYSIRCMKDNTGGMSPALGREAFENDLLETAGDEIRLFPNPANTEVSLEISSSQESECSIQISDLMGRLMLAENRLLQNGTNLLSFDISSFSHGVYLVHVGKGNSRKVYRLVKN